jgi:uncharacterized membrane protein
MTCGVVLVGWLVGWLVVVVVVVVVGWWCVLALFWLVGVAARHSRLEQECVSVRAAELQTNKQTDKHHTDLAAAPGRHE